MSHDQNFKHLILDYPVAALAFFAPDEASEGLQGAKVLPVRQEQLKERLGDRFRELLLGGDRHTFLGRGVVGDIVKRIRHDPTLETARS
jgi:hypothetical protein